MIKLVIDNIVYSIQKIGGISLVFYELSSRFMRDPRYEVRFIESKNAEDNYYRRLLNISNLFLIRYIKQPIIIFRYLNPKLGIKGPYIFHSSYYRTSRDKNAINVTTVHDFTYERSNKKDLATLVHIWQQKRAVAHSDIIICISENTKRDLLYYYKDVDKRKVFVVYNGVSDEFKKLHSINDDILPFKRGTYCIYVGVRRQYKNYKLAIESLINTDYNIVLVGSPLNEEEIHFLNDSIGSNRYICFSNVPNERLNQLYNGAFCLLYLSSYEGFGIPCVEAQKAGCPVIAYNASSIPEVICNKEILCNELTIEEVRRKMCLLEQSEYRARIISEGLEFANRFSWDKCYSELTNIYFNAMSEWNSNEENSSR